jgi:general secretion pathway protein D
MRATVVRDDKVLTGATADKYRLIRAEQENHLRNRGILTRKKDIPLLPEWESTLRKPELKEEQPAPTQAEE